MRNFLSIIKWRNYVFAYAENESTMSVNFYYLSVVLLSVWLNLGRREVIYSLNAILLASTSFLRNTRVITIRKESATIGISSNWRKFNLLNGIYFIQICTSKIRNKLCLSTYFRVFIKWIIIMMKCKRNYGLIKCVNIIQIIK